MSSPAHLCMRLFCVLCGWPAISCVASAYGLSPRVRGNPSFVSEGSFLPRSIPACAGEPSPVQTPPQPSGVYPRVCGGTTLTETMTDSSPGLSPRVRGNPYFKTLHTVPQGSIPACAGEPLVRYRMGLPSGVYPRVCGGTVQAERQPYAFQGLSPRVRGNRELLLPAVVARSIPACAGEPSFRRLSVTSLSVYPRVCGGTDLVPYLDLLATGLSPRVRGNPTTYVHTAQRRGSIPACAGEPRWITHSLRDCKVYPRVCGGTSIQNGLSTNPAGLSPRVRGNQNPGENDMPLPRSIPACAGEPRA